MATSIFFFPDPLEVGRRRPLIVVFEGATEEHFQCLRKTARAWKRKDIDTGQITYCLQRSNMHLIKDALKDFSDLEIEFDLPQDPEIEFDLEDQTTEEYFEGDSGTESDEEEPDSSLFHSIIQIDRFDEDRAKITGMLPHHISRYNVKRPSVFLKMEDESLVIDLTTLNTFKTFIAENFPNTFFRDNLPQNCPR